MRTSAFVLWAVAALLGFGCSQHQQIVLSSNDGLHHLIYDTDTFAPQAKTQDDIRVLIDASSQIQQSDPQDAVTRMTLISCIFPPPDYKRLERVIYDYKVAQLKRQK